MQNFPIIYTTFIFLGFLLFSFFSQHLVSYLHPTRVHQERPAPWASAATLDPQVHLESRDFLVPQAKRAPRETLDPLEASVKTVPQDWEVSPEREDCLEPLWVWPREILIMLIIIIILTVNVPFRSKSLALLRWKITAKSFLLFPSREVEDWREAKDLPDPLDLLYVQNLSNTLTPIYGIKRKQWYSLSTPLKY